MKRALSFLFAFVALPATVSWAMCVFAHHQVQRWADTQRIYEILERHETEITDLRLRVPSRADWLWLREHYGVRGGK